MFIKPRSKSIGQVNSFFSGPWKQRDLFARPCTHTSVTTVMKFWGCFWPKSQYSTNNILLMRKLTVEIILKSKQMFQNIPGILCWSPKSAKNLISKFQNSNFYIILRPIWNSVKIRPSPCWPLDSKLHHWGHAKNTILMEK